MPWNEKIRRPPELCGGLAANGTVRRSTETLDEHPAWLDEILPGWCDNHAPKGA